MKCRSTIESSPTSLPDKTDYKKPRHSDPGSTQLPPHIPRHPSPERRPTGSNKVPVKLGSLPSRETVPSAIDTEAPNQKACDHYTRYPTPESAKAAMKITTRLLSGPWDKAKAERCVGAMRVARVPIDRAFYVTLIKRSLEAREVREAVGLLGAMRQDRFVPDAKLCDALVVACENIKEMDGREKVFAVMRELKIARNAWPCRHYRDGKGNSEYAVRKTMAYLGTASWEETLACVGEMWRAGINFDPISRSIAHTYPKENLDKEAQQILGDFQDARIVVDTDTLDSLVAACKDADLHGKAGKLLEEAVVQRILRPTLCFNPLTHTLDLRRSEIEVATPSSKNKNTILPPALAVALFEYHRTRKEEIESAVVGTKEDGQTRIAIAKCMRDAGVAHVTGVKPDGSPDLNRLESGWAVVRRCMESGMDGIALKVFEEMMEQDLAICSALIPQCHEHLPADQASSVCSVFISICAKRGQIDDALGAFRQMLGKGYYPSAHACTDLILACGTASRLDYAEEVFSAGLSSGLKTEESLYRAMIKTCEQGGWPEGTIHVFDAMMRQASMQPDAGSYIATIAACRQVEHARSRSAQLVAEAVQNGTFDPTLGYVPGTPGASGYTLRFSADAVAAKPLAELPSPLPRFFVRVLFEHHLLQKRISAGTRFIIPSHDKTAEAEIGRLLQGTHPELTLTLEANSPEGRHLVLSKAQPFAQRFGEPQW